MRSRRCRQIEAQTVVLDKTMDQNKTSYPSAFDQVAASYDSNFTTTLLGQMLRKRVWDSFEEQFQDGFNVLDLACGTGEDALWLAQQGIHVTALDGSSEMVQLATDKANQHQHSGDIVVRQFSLEEMMDKPRTVLDRMTAQRSQSQLSGSPNGDSLRLVLFDGASSNFGGLNVIDSWSELANALATVMRPGGKVVLVPMGPFCPWEILWNLLHAKPRRAFRRFSRKTYAAVGNSDIPIWYPSPGQLKKDFQPWFKPLSTASLGFLLPPTNLSHLVERWPRFFSFLQKLERMIGGISFGWGDHFILIMERNEKSSES